MKKNKLETVYSISCPHFGPCAGCTIQTDLDRFAAVNEAQTFFYEKTQKPTPVHFFGATEWRTRVKLVIRGTVTAPEIGLFKTNSHEVLSIPHCQVHHPLINQAVEVIRQWIIANKIPPYDEIHQTGVLRYLQCTVERTTQSVQLALVSQGQLPLDLVEKLWQQSPLWHSIWSNENNRNDNVIFSDKWSLHFGKPWLWETIAGIDCCFHPAGFMQANLNAFEALLERVGELVSAPQRVIEYYAGTGIIGLFLASKGCKVQCFEVSDACESAFDLAKERLGNVQISWHCSRTETAIQALSSSQKTPDVIIVDPPRKGLDPKTLEALSHLKAGSKLIYVSCGWISCKRDIAKLIENGWSLKTHELYLFFPGSKHIETMCVLER